MDLFNNEVSSLLPYDGIVNYYGRIIPPKTADLYFDKLFNNIEWKNDEAIIYGKHITTKRKVAWYGDSNFSYTYSNTTKKALNWTKELLDLKRLVEEIAGKEFNSCLLNLYHDGNEGMTWHSDDEKELGENTSIASLSFGAERKFLFKHKVSKQSVAVVLESGSLLVMKGATQTNWFHCLPKTTKVTRPRINLTFRTIITH